MTEDAASDSGFEEIKPGPDPIEALIDRISANLTIAYEKATLEALAKLKAEDLGRFIAAFAKIKAIPGIEIGPLRQAIDRVKRRLEAGEDQPAKTPEDVLLAIVNSYSGFRDGDQVYFDLNVDDEHRETLQAGSRRLRARVRAAYHEITRQTVTSDVVDKVIGTVADRVLCGRVEFPVFCRVGADDAGNIYLDLSQPNWRYVQVTSEEWQVCERCPIDANAAIEADAPVRFSRLANAYPLPTPVHGGSINELRPFMVLREPDEAHADSFVLCVGWLLGCFMPNGPYPGLALGGPPGCGKTTFLRQLRRLIDPSRASARSAPASERDLMISAQHSYILSYDNLSKISAELSDAFCRLATGGGLATRALFTNNEEIVFEACRPIILTAINDVVTRPDLADRVIGLILAPREGDDKRPDDLVEEEFQAAWPRILGALLTAVSVGLKRLAMMAPMSDLPRMAQFAAWVQACEPGLGWAEGTFLREYRKNIRSSADTVVEADPVASAIVKWVEGFAESQPVWEGTASEALALLNAIVGHSVQSKKGWPKSPRALSNRFRSLGPTLEKLGLGVRVDRILDGKTLWKVERDRP